MDSGAMGRLIDLQSHRDEGKERIDSVDRRDRCRPIAPTSLQMIMSNHAKTHSSAASSSSKPSSSSSSLVSGGNRRVSMARG